jgi:hypothetical protein
VLILRTHLARKWLIVLVMLLAAPALASAQESQPAQTPPETREEALRREREAKQKQLAPYHPNAVESAMNLAEKKVQPLLIRDGLYAKLGSITTGSGFAYGAGFRNRRLFNRRGSGDIWAAGSLKHYWTIEGRLNLTPNPNGIVSIDGFARRLSYAQEEFSGVGPDSQRADRSDYKLFGSAAGVRATLRPGPERLFAFGAGTEFMAEQIFRGTNDTIPSTADLFNDTTAPGLTEQPNFVHTFGFAALDYRQPINARKGGWYRIDFGNYADQTNGAFSFRRTQIELRQYASVLAERRVLAFRAWLATTDVDAGSQVPFYLMPYLGGNDTLRGFRAYRFRGPHAMLLQAEYRFEIWSGFDGALFYDTGKVTNRRADLNFKALEKDFGFGFRFNTDEGIIARVDAAFGSRDGRHLHIVFGTLF